MSVCSVYECAEPATHRESISHATSRQLCQQHAADRHAIAGSHVRYERLFEKVSDGVWVRPGEQQQANR